MNKLSRIAEICAKHVQREGRLLPVLHEVQREFGCVDAELGMRIPDMLDAAVDGTFKAIYIQGEDILQSDPNTHHVSAWAGGDGMRDRA